MKKIVSRDGSSIQLQDDGQIWTEQEKDTFISPGYVVNGFCNVFKLLGVAQKYDKYFGVEDKILKYADRFKIKALRMQFNEIRKTGCGDKLIVTYGIIPEKKFEHLRERRKLVPCHSRQARLLKQSDFTFKKELS